VPRICVVLAALLTLLAVLPATAAAERCRDVIDTGPTGFDPADSDRIRTKDVGCTVARRLAAKAGLVAVRGRVRRLGFTCRDLGLQPNGFSPARCADGERRVFWVLGNAERRCPGGVFIADPGYTVRFWVQGLTCRRARVVLVNSDPFPPGWTSARDPSTGQPHVWRTRGRAARIRYRAQ
jgi:hypothetical protein